MEDKTNHSNTPYSPDQLWEIDGYKDQSMRSSLLFAVLLHSFILLVLSVGAGILIESNTTNQVINLKFATDVSLDELEFEASDEAAPDVVAAPKEDQVASLLTGPQLSSRKPELETGTPTTVGKVLRVRRLEATTDESSLELLYLNAWQRQVEAVGLVRLANLNIDFGKLKSLKMMARIGKDGRIRQAAILQSSGSSLLDKVALEILRQASPYPRFQKQLADQVDELEIIRIWEFGTE